MKKVKEFYNGFRYYPRAWRFLHANGLGGWLWFSALANLLIFIFVIYLAWQYGDDLGAYLTGLTGWEPREEGWQYGAQLVLKYLIRIVLVLLSLKVFRYLVLTIMAPVLAYLSEEIQERLTGFHKPFSWLVLWKDIIRGVAIALLNFVMEMGLTILILILGWTIPVLSPAVPPIIFIIESYFIGFSMMDYRNEFIGLSAGESRRSINRHIPLVMGNGLTFNLMLFVPLLGVLFAPVLSLTAAGLAYNEADNPENYADTIQKSLHRKDTESLPGAQ